MSEYDYDLIIVGAGSGNMLPDESMEDWRIAVVESDDPRPPAPTTLG